MVQVASYLLDTNFLVALVRGNDLGRYLDQAYGLRSGFGAFLLSAVTLGEMLALARKFAWGPRKRVAMQALVAGFNALDINHPDILDAYAEIDTTCDAAGRPMGKNDVWIAATARATHTTLLTTDKDFDFLHPTLLTRIWVDPASQPTP